MENITVFELLEKVVHTFETDGECINKSKEGATDEERWEVAFWKSFQLDRSMHVLDYNGQKLREKLWKMFLLAGSAQSDLVYLNDLSEKLQMEEV
tara:strand:+ start:935 stop:1219 length:285 start_codon:yes stop_codon:yes gene_type:complete